MKRGCDISHHQGEIDWLLLSTRGLDFAYIRSSYGTIKDTRFKYNWRAAASVIERGIYHYFLAGNNVKDQFDTIIEQNNNDWGERAPFLDLEWQATDGSESEPSRVGNYLLRVCAMLDMMDQASNSCTVIYSRTNIITKYLPQPAEDTAAFQLWASLGNRPLILAQYNDNTKISFSAPTTVPLPWFDWTGHQFSADGNRMAHYYGCKNSHDIDLIRMREDVDFPCPPEPPPPPPPISQRWKVVVAKLNIREEASSTSADLGDLFLGDIVEELEHLSTPNELWIRHSLGWSAAVYFGDRYMEAL